MEKFESVADFEKEALQILDQNALDYFTSGADDEITLAENKKAFKRWLIRPRILVDVSHVNLTTSVLGKEVGLPIGISPTAMQKLCHADGELANARAAASVNTIFILSTLTTSSMEEVAEASPNGRKWFQLSVYKDREFTTNLIRRAESCGFEAIVLTVDAPVLGKRRQLSKFYLPKHLRLANFSLGAALNDVNSQQVDSSLTWNDVDWLKKMTQLPIIIKGILTAEDATLAVEKGVDAIFVSNHGGRQLDTVNATIDLLEGIVQAVNDRCEVYLDCGVSSGADAFKALALGAKMVFAGRPFIWGLTVGGEQGSNRVLEIFQNDLKRTMALAGAPTIQRIRRDFLQRTYFDERASN